MLRDDLHADCRIFDVRKRSFRRESDGVQGEFFVLDTNDWVNVLALTKQNEPRSGPPIPIRNGRIFT